MWKLYNEKGDKLLCINYSFFTIYVKYSERKRGQKSYNKF